MWSLFSEESDDYEPWLVTAVPPNSYAIEIGYLDPAIVSVKPSDADNYPPDTIKWMDLPMRFPNYAQANIYATKKYDPILYRIVGSNFKSNYFKYDDYQNHEKKTTRGVAKDKPKSKNNVVKNNVVKNKTLTCPNK